MVKFSLRAWIVLGVQTILSIPGNYEMVLSGLWVDTNGRFLGADGAVPLKVCPAGEIIPGRS